MNLSQEMEPLSKQLKQKGKTFDSHKMSHFTKDAQAINRLVFRTIVSEAEAVRLRERLTKKIVNHVNEHNA